MTEYKYQVVYSWIQDRINDRTYKFGQKLPSENFLCQKFAVSRQSVRKAYDILVSEGYVYSIHGSGYFVKKEVEQSGNKTIGIVLSYLADHMFPNILMGIEEVLLENGYGMHLGITENCFSRERKCLELVERDGIAGLIVEGTKSALPNPNLKYYQNFLDLGVPVVFIHNYYPELNVPSVLMDDINCSKELTQLMIQAGHTIIGGAFKYDDLQGHRRFQGYIEAMNEAGIPIIDDNIRWFYSRKELWTQNRYGISFEDPTKNGVTGFLFYNDMLAAEFYQIAKEIGLKIPKELSVVALDDQNVQLDDGLYLTTARHPRKKLGIKAAEVLLQIIEGNRSLNSKEKIIVPTKIIERDSVLPAIANETEHIIRR